MIPLVLDQVNPEILLSPRPTILGLDKVTPILKGGVINRTLKMMHMTPLVLDQVNPAMLSPQSTILSLDQVAPVLMRREAAT